MVSLLCSTLALVLCVGPAAASAKSTSSTTDAPRSAAASPSAGADNPAFNKLSTHSESSAALWIAEKIGGGIIGGAASAAFNQILKALGGGDETIAKLDELKSELDAMKTQLDQLQRTMDEALRQVIEAKYATLSQRVIDLRDRIVGGDGQSGSLGRFLTALSYASDPSKKSAQIQLVHEVEAEVTAPGGLADITATVPEAIVPSALTQKPFYQVLSNVVTGANTKIVTWRQSAYIDSVYQYLLYLQAIQFMLIIEVRTAQGITGDTLYNMYGKSYLGSKSEFQDFLDHKVTVPKSGWLHDELAAELKVLPPGAVVDSKTDLEWSVDVPGGAADFTFARSGPDSWSCPYNKRTSCLDDPYKPVTNKRVALADTMESKGYGGKCADAACWNLPSVDQLTSLFAGWNQAADGPARAWLESRSSADATTCVHHPVGSAENVSDAKSCVWPEGNWFEWGAWKQKSIKIYESYFDAVTTTTFDYNYGWSFQYLGTNPRSVDTCDVTVHEVQWSEVGHNWPYGYTPHSGGDDSWYWNPNGKDGCSGPMFLVRQPAHFGEQFYFPI